MAIPNPERGNRTPRYPNTVVVAISTKERTVPSCARVVQSAQNALAAPSFVKCEQVLTISKVRLESRLGRLSHEDFARVTTALWVVLEL